MLRRIQRTDQSPLLRTVLRDASGTNLHYPSRLIDGVGVGDGANRAVAASWKTCGAKFERSVTSSAT